MKNKLTFEQECKLIANGEDLPEEKQIEEMAKDIPYLTLDRTVFVGATETKNVSWMLSEEDNKLIAEHLVEKGWVKLPENCVVLPINEDSVVMSKEDYEKLKSLYDTQKGAIMTSSIGDLPLTVEGLRKAVDEITRLNRVETELQELNAKYYNEAKDLRRKIKEAQDFYKASYVTEQESSKKTADKIKGFIFSKLDGATDDLTRLILREIYWQVDEFTKQLTVEIKEN